MNASNVSAGKPKISGAVYRAPLSTALPSDAIAELNEAFVSMGHIGDAGLTNSYTMSGGEVKAWGGDVVLTYTDSKKDVFKFKMIEALNPDVLKAVHGDGNVTGSLAQGIAVKAGGADQTEHSWVMEMLLKGGVPKRIVVPAAAVTELGDVVYADNGVIGYEVTLTATRDAAGFTHYEYIGGAAANAASAGGEGA